MLTHGNSVTAPAGKVTAEQIEQEATHEPVSSEQSTLFRSVPMWLGYLAQDRPDFAEADKSLCRRMVSPKSADFQTLKRVVRYLKLRPRLVTVYDVQRLQRRIRVWAGPGLRGELLTRRSTSSAAVFYGDHLVRVTSNLQSTISLSSCESEYYACVQGAALALGISSVLQD